MGQKFANNATATLAASISSSSVSLTVTTGQGALFPALSSGDYFYVTLVDSSNNVEYVKITARTGDTLTAVRGQDGSTARAYAAADRLALRPIAATLNDMQTATAALVQAALQALYPIGSIYSSTVSTSPATLFGFGTWVAYAAGRVMIGDGGGFTAGATGGSADAIAVAHTHTFGATTGGQSQSHNHSISVSDPGHAHNVVSEDGYKLGTMPGGSVNARQISNGDIGIKQNFYGASSNTTGITASSGNASQDHTHSVSGTTGSTGSSGTGANLQPYVVVYMWNRTA